MMLVTRGADFADDDADDFVQSFVAVDCLSFRESWGGYGGLLIAADIICCCSCAELIKTWMMLATSRAEFADDDVNDVVGGFSSWTVYHLGSWGGYGG